MPSFSSVCSSNIANHIINVQYMYPSDAVEGAQNTCCPNIGDLLNLLDKIQNLFSDQTPLLDVYQQLQLDTLAQTLRLASLAGFFAKRTPLAGSLHNLVCLHHEDCHASLLQLFEFLERFRLGLHPLNIGFLWGRVCFWAMKEEKSTVDELQKQLLAVQRLLNKFLLALKYVVWTGLSNVAFERLPLFRALLFHHFDTPVFEHIPIQKITIVDHLGRLLPVPMEFCSRFQDINYLILGYCRGHLGMRYIHRGDYQLIEPVHNQAINPLEVTRVLHPETVLEMSIILRQWQQGTDVGDSECPRCSYMNASVALDGGWIECMQCSGQYMTTRAKEGILWKPWSDAPNLAGDSVPGDERASHQHVEQQTDEQSVYHKQRQNDHLVNHGIKTTVLPTAAQARREQSRSTIDEILFFRRIHVIMLYPRDDNLFLYKNTIKFLMFMQQRDKRTDISDTLTWCVQAASVLDPVSRLKCSRDLYKQLLNVSQVLSVSPSELSSVLHEDANNIIILLRDVLESSIHKNAALKLEDEDAQKLIDSIQFILRNASVSKLPNDLRSKAHNLVIKLSKQSGMLPSTIFITGVQEVVRAAAFSGGFGDVFRATYNGIDVALKCIRPCQGDDGRHHYHQKLCREALLWQRLRHPNILPFLGIDMDTFPPFHCLVSPWMKHGTIIKFLKNNSHALLGIQLVEIAKGLDYLHSQNIVHGDLRGNNILVDDECHVHLADFGLTVHTDATMGGGMSTNGGSCRWMAPELLYPELFELDHFRRTSTSDMYSFGCVLLELHTGRCPFDNIPHEPAVTLKVIQGNRPTRPPGLTDGIWSLMQKCWSHSYKDRPSAYSVIKELESLAGP